MQIAFDLNKYWNNYICPSVPYSLPHEKGLLMWTISTAFFVFEEGLEIIDRGEGGTVILYVVNDLLQKLPQMLRLWIVSNVEQIMNFKCFVDSTEETGCGCCLSLHHDIRLAAVTTGTNDYYSWWRDIFQDTFNRCSTLCTQAMLNKSSMNTQLQTIGIYNNGKLLLL